MERVSQNPREIMGTRADERTSSCSAGQCTVEEHARKRIESIYLQCTALYNLFPNSRNIQLSFKGAELQGQTASDGNQACHFNPFSNLQTNLRARVTRQIKSGDLTPGTTKGLRVLGLDSPGLKKMKSEKTKEHVHEVMSKHLIVDILDAKTRELAVKLCGTDALPTHVNHTDSNMEKYVKPLALEVFKKLLIGKIKPIEATVSLQKHIKNHFQAAIERIESVNNAYKLAISEAKELINDRSTLEIRKEIIEKQLKIIKTPKKPGLGGKNERSPKYDIDESLSSYCQIWKEVLEDVVSPRLDANRDQLKGTEAFKIPDSEPDSSAEAQVTSNRVRDSAQKNRENKSPGSEKDTANVKRKISFNF